jgi:hypothetical protein
MPRANDYDVSDTGAFERQCRVCAKTFHTDNPRVVYCTAACKKRASNAAHYDRHRDALLAKAKAQKAALATELEELRDFKRQVEAIRIAGDQRMGSWADQYDPYDEQEANGNTGETT